MPFHLRTVQPTQVCRLGGTDGQTDGSALVLASLEEVSVHSMLRIIQQLSDLSRHAEDIFSSIHGQAVTLGERSARLQRRLASLHHLVSHLDHRKVPVPVSNLDEESKWTVHYRASWHQQENVFLPSSRPPCVEDLHRQAKVNLKTVLRECDKLRRDGYRSSQYYSQGPTFSSSPNMVCTSYPEDDEEYSRKFSVSSSEEERLLTGKRPKTPVPYEFSDTHTNWTKSLPLPTPEEKMRQEAQAIQTDMVPINVTGENFDRQASFRRSLIHTDTVVRRPKKVKRRKTITGVPDNIQKELAGAGQIGFRGHSMHIPESYNALDNLEPCLSPSLRSETRDFSCQTEEVKIVPPSVRRIRAQKGQGIAALMSGSSGNMSTLSDPAGCSLRPNGDLNFRSLPRTGARVCLQSLEQRTESSNRIEDSFITLPRQLSKLKVDESVVHLRNNHRPGTLPRPKSQEVRGSERDTFSNPACVVSPHAAYSTSVIPNAMLSSSSEVIAINTSQSSGQLDSKPSSHSSSSNSKSVCRELSISSKGDHRFCSTNWSENSSLRHSQASDAISPGATMIINLGDHIKLPNNTNSMNNGPQTIPYKRNAAFHSLPHDSDTHSESSYSDGRQRNGSITSSINSTDQWPCETRENDSNVPLRKPSSAVSGSPVSNMSTCSSDRKADTSSLYSLDHDGYYTSMHIDSGVGSGNQRQHNGIQNPRHSVFNIFDKKDTLNQDDTSSYSDKSLTRSISLKKPKKPPPPPSRTDSLRRPPKKDLQSNGQVLNEKLIATLQQSLQLNLKSKSGSSPSQSPCSDYEDPWVLRSRSQSTVSASSSGLSATAANMYSICPITPSHSETSSIKSEYADQWSYYIDEQPKSTLHSPKKSEHSSEQQMHSGLSKPINSSPEKPCRVTSPSSGYSSQSNTPTNLTPVPLLMRSMSPGTGKNKVKPKVPERRSSLISSVSISSSSTSLSSNTSDSAQQAIKKTTMVLPSSPTPSLTPDPPPPPMINVVDNGTLPPSPNLPPPPPEAAVFLSPGDNLWLSHSENIDKCTQKPYPPQAPPPPPLPTLHFKTGNARFVNPLNIPPNKQELVSPIAPLITAQALQMVQLKSIKKASQPEAENIAEQVPQPELQYVTSPIFSRPSSVPSVSSDLSYSKSIRENKNVNLHVEQLQYSDSSNKSARFTTVENTNDGGREEEYRDSALNGDKSMLSEMSSPQKKASTSKSPPNASPNKKPPPVSKKPKLFLIVPPPQLDLAAEKIAQVNENVRSMPKASEKDSVSEHCEEVNGRTAGENSLEEAASLNCQAGEETVSSCKVAEDITVFTLSPALESPNHQEEEEQPTMSDEASVPDGKNGSTNCDQNIFQEDDTADVFETKTASSPRIRTNDRFDGRDEMLTPTRPRTTEDLFAVIHRSKRKVLGRKDSDDDRGRNHSPSPPVTPTGGVPNVSSFKQPGAIQRSIRKTNTSNDNFKALLLKKGSRSECGSRMSAAEMLKHTDPRFQRSQSDSSVEQPDSPTLNSPSKNKRAQEEWAKSEGIMPRSMSVSGTRYSRSRTPPSAASSKYNVRSRLQSSPMTVICEWEGEMADAVENRCTKAPLMSTMSLDRCQRTNFELNDSVGADSFQPRVHIDLMSRFSDVSPSKDNDSS
ncbi:PREDICTED: NHS-like protein 1 [Nanorana parkeri]|uniref:NHS-like protein 1 n=1 Tax=Nanorana parkeri TaxID=125878 RepID=UPI000854409B|nr:PREDICTED: NHS-like protein 1 [Nanorana parkeri]